MASRSRILESPHPPGTEPGALFFETERLIVRRYLAADAPALAAAANHIEVSDFMSDRFPSPYTAEAALQFFALHEEAAHPAYPTQAAVLLKPNTADNPSSEPRMIGGLGAHTNDDILYRTWTLGYFLTPSAWGKGYATEALSAFTLWVFKTWPHLNRVEGEAYGHNVASQRVLEKSGLKREGVKRGAAEKQGALVDLVMFGIIREDLQPQNR
ncbi:acetyltransferase [Purpureocillium lavendulum]|uniref:Acetyltransferase n=1 Tax=Purpureocillium lavendulum TaxID=1247861 RepID=A0AB34G3Y1_9HYPO|nr:acetyltransferase [Purpureocillium lavendulum]